jgi:hypothetical protein
MKQQCEFCKNVFSTKTNLINHQRKAKYCLKIQGSSRLKDASIICEGCGKVSTSKWNHQIHIEKCKKSLKVNEISEEKIELENKNNELKVNIQILNKELKNKDKNIEDLKSQIQQLQDKLENIAIKAVQRPTTTNMNKTQINNYIQKMDPLSLEHMLEQSSNLTLEHIQKGASGYAEYALEYPLKERIACVDYSRRKMKFKDKDGNLITDPEMVKLAPMFFNSIKEKSSEIVYSQNDANMDSAMFEAVAKLFNMNADVKNGADGIKSDFYHDFIKQVCSGSVVE